MLIADLRWGKLPRPTPSLSAGVMPILANWALNVWQCFSDLLTPTRETNMRLTTTTNKTGFAPQTNHWTNWWALGPTPMTDQLGRPLSHPQNYESTNDFVRCFLGFCLAAKGNSHLPGKVQSSGERPKLLDSLVPTCLCCSSTPSRTRSKMAMGG